MTSNTQHCDGCGHEAPVDSFQEGWCGDCYRERQRALDEHNARYDQWSAMTDNQRWDAVRRELR
jgi:hypothetical protein